MKTATLRRIGLVGLSLVGMLALRGSAEADVELHPALIQGNFALTGQTIQSVYAYAYSNDGFSASGSFTGSSFQLTVEGGHSFRRQIEGTISNSGATSYLQVVRNTFIPAAVGDTVQDDYAYDVGSIAGTITVVGGTLSSYQLYASASTSTESYNVRHYDYSSGATTDSFSFPMVPDDSVRLYGSATVITSAGTQLTRPLDERTLSNFTAAGASADFSIDLTNLDTTTGSFSGLVSASPVNGTDIVASHQVYANGRSGTPTQGLFSSVSVSANGPYLLDDLVAGEYDLYSYSWFDAPYGYLFHPYGTGTNPSRRSVVAGSTTTRDFVANLGVMGGTFTPHGFVTQADLDYAYVTANGVDGTATYGGGGLDYVGSDGAFALAVPEGSWIPWAFTAQVYDNSDASHPINAYFSATEYWRHPSYGGTPVNVSAGTTVSVPGYSPDIAETSIMFDVAEPSGSPEVDISNPYVYGYRYEYGPGGRLVKIASVNAYGPSQASPKPSVRLVGEPGTYNLTAYATVRGTSTTFATFQFTLEEPQSTPAGTDVQVPASEDVQITFANVTSGGVTTATQLPIGPAAPEGFRVLAPGGTPVYWDISTTATFSGMARVCVTYPDTDDQGNPLWDPPSKERHIRLAHFDTATSSWVNITVAPYPDVNVNKICGDTPSFSPFAILIPEDPDLDGVIGDDDNCPEVANEDQADLDADDQGDACDEDDDGDGVPDGVDNCPVAGGGQSDLDGDGMGDACDTDDDGDAVDDDLDNCPVVSNGGQADFDLDGLGDACDDDDDDDGTLDDGDTCAATELGDATDTSGCSSEQRMTAACPTTASYRNHGQYVRCVAQEADAQVALGLITVEQKDAIVSQAAGSAVGK